MSVYRTIGPTLVFQLGAGVFFLHTKFPVPPPTPEDIFAEVNPTGCMFILMTPTPEFILSMYISYLKMLNHIQIGLYSALQHILLKY